MRFCKNCKNLYYIKLDGDDDNEDGGGDKLIYYCRKCGDSDDTLMSSLDNMCVSKSTRNENEGSYKYIVNKYTKYDPTLPRITGIKCPNINCSRNASDKEGKDEKEGKEGNEILYLRYDDANMKFVYICVDCDTIWKSTTN
jgi:DNA-directed RNA polymerase subunit M/transcription elongation factor TFIIS